MLLFTLAFTFYGCSDDNGTQTPLIKTISGELGSEFNVNSSSTQSAITSLISANQIWAIPMSKTDYFDGASNVNFNYTAMFEEKQVFDIKSDGSFELSIKEPCRSTVSSTCLGFVLLLVDPTEKEKKDQIKGFLSLNGENSLIRFPFAEISNNINMGTINSGSGDQIDEVVGNTIESAQDSFNISLDELKLLAHTDDYMKLVKNVYINPTKTFLIRYQYIDDNAKYDFYTNFDDAILLGSSFSIFNTNSDENFIDDGTETYSVYPPQTVSMTQYDENGTKLSSEDFNQSNPFTLNGANTPIWAYLSPTRMDIGNAFTSSLNGHYCIENNPSGFWTLKDSKDTILGEFDLQLISPLNLEGKAKSYVPALKFERNSYGYIYKVLIKWYLYDGSSYEAVRDLDRLWESISRYTLTVGNVYNLAPGQLELTLISPMNPNDLNSRNTKIQYGFYANEIEIRYIIN